MLAKPVVTELSLSDGFGVAEILSVPELENQKMFFRITSALLISFLLSVFSTIVKSTN